MLKVLSVVVLLSALTASERQKPVAWTTPPSATIPLAFVANAGQTEPRVRFYAQSAGATFYFTPTEAAFTFAKGANGHALRLTFPGANPAPRLEGQRRAAGTINYLIGDEADWRKGIPTYTEVIYRDLWPGIDLAFRGADGELKYEFHLAPGANAADIRLAYGGADRLSIDTDGALHIQTTLGVLRDNRPESYQTIDGRQVAVASQYMLTDGGYRFALAAFDPALPLVIDPGLEYATYLGGGGSEQGLAIAVDSSGSAYVTGSLFQSAFPTTTGAFDTTIGGSADAFVSKFDASGALVYSTYLGGSSDDTGSGIAVDSAGRAYVTGVTGSPDFPTTAGAFDRIQGGGDAFVARLDPSGTALDYSTYLGGSGLEPYAALGLAVYRPHIALDSLESAYVTGTTNSIDFPTTEGAFDRSSSGTDVFVSKLNAAGSALVYSTYLGASASNFASGIAVDAAGSAYVTGLTNSGSFPTTPGAFDTSFNSPGSADAFVTKLNPWGTALEYSTYLGAENIDEGVGIAVDGSGSAYVTGLTTSFGFPTTPCAFDRARGGFQDAFVTKLNPDGSALVYSTYLGSTMSPAGSSGDQGIAITVDGSGAAYVTGVANGPDFPLTADAVDTAANSADAFLTKINPAGTGTLFSSYLGGSNDDRGTGVALDGDGRVYIVGTTQSSDFPTTANASDTGLNGSTDAFMARLHVDTTAAPVATTITLALASSTNPVGTAQTVTASVEDADAQPLAGVIVRFIVTGVVSRVGQCTTDASGSCDFGYQGPSFPGSDTVTAFADSDGNNVKGCGEPSASARTTWIAHGPATVTLTPAAETTPVGSQHCVTATVADASGVPVSGAIVRFTIAGATNITAALTSDANGEAVFCYTGPDLPGADDITAHADADGDGLEDASEPLARTTNTWIMPEATPGHVTGAGQAPGVGGEGHVAFGFSAKSVDGAVTGNCNLVDQNADLHLKCVDVTSLVRESTHATIFGNATINGVATQFRIDVDDEGEPGGGRDTFRLVTSNGYAAGGVLSRGNIHVR